MSGGQAISREEARRVATTVIDFLKREKCVDRIEIAGSLRRGKAEVHDIELVAIPKYSTDGQQSLTGNRVSTAENLLHTELEWMLKEGIINTDRPRKDQKKNPFGPKYYRINFKYYSKKFMLEKEYPIDLFVVLPPAQWGVIYLIRTGSADFSHWIVQQGYKYGIHFTDGHMEMQNMVLDTPEENDVFNYLKIPYREPEYREVK